MYHPRIIKQKLDKFERAYGWRPVEHSIAEIDRINDYFKSLYVRDKDGDLIFPDEAWTEELRQFVQNERAMCAMNCEYFLTRYYWIAADAQLIRFTFRSGQRAFFSVVQDLEAQGRAIEIQTLKARQQGISTLVEGMMTHLVLFRPGTKASVGSADTQKTYVMLGMMYTALDHIPWWLSPTKTTDRRSGRGLMEFSNIGTSIVIQSGTIKGGIGQGTTPNAIHLSETCDYTNPVMQIEEGLFKAVHSSPEIFMILESTGNGNSGWWAEQWRTNKEFYWQGKARLLPLFLPWFMTPELYPTSTWIKSFPIPRDWKPAEETINMTVKCEAYVRSTPILEKILGKKWTLPPEQQWFWEFNYQDCKRRGTAKSWLRQMPCDDFEALIGENDTVFDADTVSRISRTRSKTYTAYGIVGEGIAERHDPAPVHIDPFGDRLYSSWYTPREEKLEWYFMPFHEVDERTFDPLKKLIIYEMPERGADYSIGIDTGTGVGGDRTIISVTRSGEDEHSDVQVAEFSSDDISQTEIYAFAAAISALYSRFMEEGRHPKLIIEQRRKYGDTCQHQLLLMGMKRHHEFVQYDKKTFKAKTSGNGRLGWFTNAWSRPMLLGMFKYAVENGWYEVNSKWLLAEIEAFEQKMTTEGKTRMDHASGKHDDRIFAAAMSYFTNHHIDVMIERAKLKYNKPLPEEVEIDYSPSYTQVSNGGEEFFFGGRDDY